MIAEILLFMPNCVASAPSLSIALRGLLQSSPAFVCRRWPSPGMPKQVANGDAPSIRSLCLLCSSIVAFYKCETGFIQSSAELFSLGKIPYDSGFVLEVFR